MSDDFDLNVIIREELAGAEVDVGAVAERVMERIPEHLLRSVLMPALHKYVRTLQNGNASAVAQALRKGGLVDAGPQQSPTTASRASRWQAASSLYARLLKQREKVDGIDKFLGDMTVDEVGAVAAARIKLGRDSIARGRAYEGIAAKMIEVGAETVGDLTPEQLNEVFTADNKAKATAA